MTAHAPKYAITDHAWQMTDPTRSDATCCGAPAGAHDPAAPRARLTDITPDNPAIDAATAKDMLRGFAGSLVARGPYFAVLRFRDVGHAYAWARHTGMTGRALLRTPDADMSLDCTVKLQLDLT